MRGAKLMHTLSSQWIQLLSRRRLSNSGEFQDAYDESVRSAFEVDWDRILFCNALRRMHDKTQVFPLPEDDIVHSRLTHSLEVASVGRSLGKTVGERIVERHGISDYCSFHDFGDVVAAACLAHDIGNPPFGHAGEDAIARFFKQHPAGRDVVFQLSGRQASDFTDFEGNAQGFRVLARLQLEVDGGLRLSAATLGAFCKYPRESGKDLKHDRIDRKKHGFVQADAELFERLAQELGLHPQAGCGNAKVWARHPLAFLVEAADDICYSILDIEDGVRLGHVEQKSAEELLIAVARQSGRFKEDRLNRSTDKRARLGYLRAMAIGQFIQQCASVFLDNETAILEGRFDDALTGVIGAKEELGQLKELARHTCYNAPGVLEIELAGYEALAGLLGHFVPAMAAEDADDKKLDKRGLIARDLFLQRVKLDRIPDIYHRILRVTDYVSGMTDRYALSMFRRIQGIAVPGRIS